MDYCSRIPSRDTSVALSWFLAIWLGFFHLPASGSSHSQADSLKKVLLTTWAPEEKVEIYLSLARYFRTRSVDSCKYYLGEAKSLFSKINSFPYLGETYEMSGDISRFNNNFSETIRQYRISAFCYKIQGEKKQQMKMLNKLGAAYAQSDHTSEAFRYYLKAREVAKEVNDTDMMARIHNNIGRIYISSKNFRTGIDYYKKALKVFESANDSFKTATVYMNLGSAYNHINQVDSSRMFLEKAIKIFRAINDQPNLGSCLALYSYSIVPEKRYTEALGYLAQGVAIAGNPVSVSSKIESKLMLNDILYLMGFIYYEMEQYTSSKHYFLACTHLSDSLGLVERNSQVAEYLSNLYAKTGQTDSSYFYYRLFKVQSDSLMKIQSINVVRLAEAQMEYEKEVNEKKLQLAYNKSLQKRNLVIFIGVGTMLMALVLILVLRLRIEKQKKKQEEIEKKQAVLEKQTADLQLESQNKELTLNVMSLIRKNELILELSNRLIQIKEATTDDRTGTEVLQMVNTMQKSTEDNVWEEFEVRFKQVHSDFYGRLLNKFPDLTPSELKICALLKLNLSTKEICELSGQRPATLDVARYRLRKKMGISNTQANLVTFLSQV